MSVDAKLTLGPVAFNWPGEEWRDFYFKIADEAPIDVVYVGENVCIKRLPFFTQYLPDVIERLQAAGKRVVYSTLALVMTKAEVKLVHDLIAESDLPVEANDISTLQSLSGKQNVIGPFVNVYNEDTLAYLATKGVKRFVLSSELPIASLAPILKRAGELDVDVEGQVFGRLPLAVSARCYHARVHGLSKDGCEYVCSQDPDGLSTETLDGEPFLVINGTQTMSEGCCCLLAELAKLEAMGMTHFRLWPQHVDMVSVARIYRAVLDGVREPAEAIDEIAALIPDMSLINGYAHGQEGRAWVQAGE